MWVNLWSYVCVCVCMCVCMRACMRTCGRERERDWDRERERERKREIRRTVKNRWKMLTFCMFPLFKVVTSQKKNVKQHKILQLHQEIMLWNSVQRSQRRMQLSELKAQKQPMLIIKLALKCFNNFSWTGHGLRRSLFPFVQPAEKRHFENVLPTPSTHAHFVFWQGEVLLPTDCLSSTSSTRLCFTRVQLSV